MIWRLRHRSLLRTAKESGKTVDELLAEKEDCKDRADETTKDSSVVQTPVDQGVSADNHENETVASASREDRDLERGPG